MARARYEVFEMVLNEYVNHPTRTLIDVVEADSPEEANRLARMRHPNKSTLEIDNVQFER
ncbi:MAG: hypothetical protein EBS89_09315 [Proteobacteria bacterium]|nr:hypothetical protein [Pseudomonadota bacterium]